MRELLTILLTIVLAIFNAWYDASLIKQEKYIYKHTSRSIIRLTVFALMAYFIVPFYSWYQFLLMLSIVCIWFWIVFDIAMNLYMGKYWLRIGRISTIDKAMQGLGEYYAFALKFALLIGYSIAYLIEYDNIY